jgi:hypothetical protein
VPELVCFFEGGPAGHIVADCLPADLAEYPFMPYRSGSHLMLERAVARGGIVRLAVNWGEQSVETDVMALSECSITLRPVSGTY